MSSLTGFLKGLFGGGSSRLTRETIETLAPRKLCCRVLRSLPDADEANLSQRDFVHMLLLDGEVRNGGFNQYFYNNPDEGPAAERAFRSAGAVEIAELVGRANERFAARRERLEALWDGTAKGFSASCREKIFDDLDSAYYAQVSRAQFESLLAQFVRSRAGEFVPDAKS